ncbi:bifunctional diaminohydroxyphosphoribosylaminopyrimidine deaminase/5-amino-6-(5-phosphoribosylamino)uracil reductase RibD [Thalassotalea fusca]
MARAIKLAAQGRYTTSPNPRVGCVIVNDNQIVGEGFHIVAGQEHAEVHALNEAGDAAKGATAYVTLEPCSHFGRTPPCALALIKSGVSKVICAMTDPSPHVAGQGFELLTEAGITVEVGLLAEDAAALNKGYIQRVATGKPLVRCKLASSLDGKTAMANGESQWITSKAARQDVQRLRAASCAIITSAVSVIRDNARMTVRSDELFSGQKNNSYPSVTIRQPLRVVIDNHKRLTPDLPLFSEPSPILIISSSIDNTLRWPEFVEQVSVPLASDSKYLCLTSVVELLASRGLNELLVEAGNHLTGGFLEQKLVDELVLYQAPKLLGSTAMSLVNMPSVQHLTDALTLDITDVRQVGADIRINAKIKEK